MMKNFSKFIVALFGVFALVGAVGCGGPESDTESEADALLSLQQCQRQLALDGCNKGYYNNHTGACTCA